MWKYVLPNRFLAPAPDGGSSVKRKFLLEDSARPVELQQCRPRGDAFFSVTTRRGGVLRVEDSVLTPGVSVTENSCY